MRIDVYMQKSGLSESRSKAQAMISAGTVMLNGSRVKKPSEQVSETDSVTVTEPLRFVSRGGEKLLGAIEAFNIDVSEKVCVDLGASTGGFTDCLLQFGAKKVYAVDCGSDQLHPTLRSDPRVISMERLNARTLTSELLGERCDIAVMDVSFISQTLLYEAVCDVLRPGGQLVSLIKPQFETARSALGGGGILRDKKERIRAIKRVLANAEECGLALRAITSSPIKGGDGNREYLALFELSDGEDIAPLRPDAAFLDALA